MKIEWQKFLVSFKIWANAAENAQNMAKCTATPILVREKSEVLKVQIAKKDSKVLACLTFFVL
jgi:hypothetical protein